MQYHYQSSLAILEMQAYPIKGDMVHIALSCKGLSCKKLAAKNKIKLKA
jgi:hypothetical protein